jgi:hypothetical protein
VGLPENLTLPCTSKKHPAKMLFAGYLTGDTRRRKGLLLARQLCALYVTWQLSSPCVALRYSAKIVFTWCFSLPSVFYLMCRVIFLRRVLTPGTIFFVVCCFLAPGEEWLCRVPVKIHPAKENIHGKDMLSGSAARNDILQVRRERNTSPKR